MVSTYLHPLVDHAVPVVDGVPQQLLQLQFTVHLLQLLVLGHLHLHTHPRYNLTTITNANVWPHGHTVTRSHGRSKGQNTVALFIHL